MKKMLTILNKIKINYFKFFCNFNLIVFLLFLLIPFISADVYVGTCEGYIHNTEKQTVDGAETTITVNLCVVGCSQTVFSEASGYYLTANLNLAKQGAVTVYAEKNTALGLEYGQATGTANEFQAADINVTICLPPPVPTLTPEPNTHDIDVILDWTSYNDKKSYDTYDEFKIDSQPTIQSPNSGVKSQDITGLSYASHTWRVRTCNPYCCSNWASDSFNVGNSKPSTPILVNQSDTIPSILNFNWLSGIDSDSDEVYDEFCYGIINEEEECQNAASPIEIEVFGCNYYTWKVRTCEIESQKLCSDWAEDGFIACGLECPSCVCSGGGSSGSSGSGGGSGCPSTTKTQSLVVTNPLSIEQDASNPLKISFTTSGISENIWFKITSPEFNFNDYPISMLKDSKAEFELTGKPKGEIEPGVYNLTLDVLVDNQKTVTEVMSITVTKPLLINIKRIAVEIPKKKNWWIYSVLILSILIIVYFYLKYRNDNLKNFLRKNKKSHRLL